MAHQTTFMTLPSELREPIYRYIALSHTTRCIQALHSESVNTSEYKITTSAMTATCRLIHNEYEDVAKKLITSMEFTAKDLDFNHVIEYFHRQVDAKYLVILQLNKATIHVNMVVQNNRSCKLDIKLFYDWALFLLGIKLEAAYHSDRATWMEIFETNPVLTEQCVIEEDSTQFVRDNIKEIRNIAGVFDKAMWRAYAGFRQELQARRRREWDRRTLGEGHQVRIPNGAE